MLTDLNLTDMETCYKAFTKRLCKNTSSPFIRSVYHRAGNNGAGGQKRNCAFMKSASHIAGARMMREKIEVEGWVCRFVGDH